MAEYDPDEFFNRKPPNNADRVIKEQWYGALFKRTNADRIRARSDEELADFLWSIGNNPVTGNVYVNGKPIFTNQDGYKGWLDWLKSPVEVEE